MRPIVALTQRVTLHHVTDAGLADDVHGALGVGLELAARVAGRGAGSDE